MLQIENAGVAQRSWPFSKTRMCKFNLLGMCVKGEQCLFAHSTEELQPLPDLSRTKLCKVLIDTGKCEDPECKYAHNKDQLRNVDPIDRSQFSSRGKGDGKSR